MSDAPESWESYYAKTGTRPPRETLLFALDRFDAELKADDRRFAIDLGCGNGRDTVELLRRGWHTLAVDAESSAIDGLRARPDLPADVRLDTLVSRFEDAKLPEADLVNSSFALPLVDPPRFPDLWDGVVAALRSGGRVSCQLYGDRDSWVGRPGMTFFTRGGVDALLEPLDVEFFREEEDDSVTPRGQPKHWHIFHIVARTP
jgi:SAM-dependent methyltransferase